MDDLTRDIRFALRVLLGAKGFSLLAIATLGIGIAASTTIFSALHGVLLRPLPYTDSDRLAVVWESNRAEAELRSGVSPAVFVALRDLGRTFTGVAAYRPWGYELGGTAEPERLRGARVTANLFSLLGVAPLYGRSFVAGEDGAEAAPVVLLSEELWRGRFGADPDVISRSIILNGQPHTVVGVVPGGFVLPEAELWVPLVFAPYELEQRGNRSLSVVARLQPGVALAAAEADADALIQRLAADFPAAHGGWAVELDDLHRDIAGSTRAPLLLLFTATCIVLLAACVNLAGLLIARSTERRREMAVRAALGASRGRIIRQLVTESMLIAAGGGVLGLVLAQTGIDVLVTVAASWLPRGTRISSDPPVFAFVILITMTAGGTVAVLPALAAGRLDLLNVMKAGPRSSWRGGIGLRDATVAGQVAIALILLVGGGLLLRSFLHAQRVDLGFVPVDVVAMRMSLPARYATPDERARFFESLETRVSALPNVRRAGLASHLPLADGLLASDFEIEGTPAPNHGTMMAHLTNVTPGYFGALGVPVIAGRGFTRDDRLGRTPVVMIDAELARRYWPDGGALGRRIRLGATLGADTAWREVVGIAGSVRAVSLERTPEPAIYIPHAQNPWPSLSLVIAAAGPLEAVTGAATAEVHALDPSRPVYAVRSLDRHVRLLLAPRRLQTMLMGGFAAAAVTLAVIGVYGLIATAVAQRTRELGIRIALGARHQEILWLCLRSVLPRIAAGIGLGIVGAAGATQAIRGVLFGTTAWDPLTFAAAVFVLGAAGVAASVVPAWRAARLDPVAALRMER